MFKKYAEIINEWIYLKIVFENHYKTNHLDFILKNLVIFDQMKYMNLYMELYIKTLYI